MIAIDFETFYSKDYSIKTLGADAYCTHEEFDPYMVALYGEGIDYVGPTDKAPWDKLDTNWWRTTPVLIQWYLKTPNASAKYQVTLIQCGVVARICASTSKPRAI